MISEKIDRKLYQSLSSGRPQANIIIEKCQFWKNCTGYIFLGLGSKFNPCIIDALKKILTKFDENEMTSFWVIY